MKAMRRIPEKQMSRRSGEQETAGEAHSHNKRRYVRLGSFPSLLFHCSPALFRLRRYRVGAEQEISGAGDRRRGPLSQQATLRASGFLPLLTCSIALLLYFAYGEIGATGFEPATS